MNYLYAGAVINAFGLAAMYANVLLWTEQYLEINANIAGLLSFTGSFGLIFIPMVTG